MSLALLLSLAAAAPEVQPAHTLADCAFARLGNGRKGTKEPPIPFALLFEAPNGGQTTITTTRVFDPRKLIEGLPILGGFYTKDGKRLFFITDDHLPFHFKLTFIPKKGGEKWTGAIGMNGAGTAAEHLYRSYLGECTIQRTADAVARFEALEQGR